MNQTSVSVSDIVANALRSGHYPLYSEETDGVMFIGNPRKGDISFSISPIDYKKEVPNNSTDKRVEDLGEVAFCINAMYHVLPDVKDEGFAAALREGLNKIEAELSGEKQ